MTGDEPGNDEVISEVEHRCCGAWLVGTDVVDRVSVVREAPVAEQPVLAALKADEVLRSDDGAARHATLPSRRWIGHTNVGTALLDQSAGVHLVDHARAGDEVSAPEDPPVEV